MRPSYRLLVISFVSAAALGGCILPASAPKSAIATGEPLHVVDDVKVWTTTEKEKVGETVYKDSSGTTVGTADQFAERTRVHSMKIWYPVQGQAQLSDEDFFRIAGDTDALNKTEQMRANGKKWNRRGMFIGGGSVVAMLAGVFIPNTIARVVLVTGGTLGSSAGWVLMRWGANQMSPETHAVDRSIAETAARSYNQTRGLSVGRTF